MRKQATSKRLSAFQMEGKTVVVPVKGCYQCAGTGEVEDYESYTPPLVDAVELRREQYGWNASKMAAKLGLTRGNYSEFVHGRRGLPLAARINAYALGIPASILLQPQDKTK